MSIYVSGASRPQENPEVPKRGNSVQRALGEEGARGLRRHRESLHFKYALYHIIILEI